MKLSKKMRNKERADESCEMGLKVRVSFRLDISLRSCNAIYIWHTVSPRRSVITVGRKW